jgi:hypothetical protein
MPTAAERQQMIARVRELPARVEAGVMGLSQQQLDASGEGGGWSVRQIVHHLADAHMNLLTRVKLGLTEEKPTIKPYDQEAWAKLADVTSMPLDASLSILQGLHQRAAVLFASLPEDAWSRQVIHPERGLLSVADLLGTFAEHGQVHLDQMAAVRKTHGW